MNPIKVGLFALAAFAAYEALHVKETGRDVFYAAPIDAEYRNEAAAKWAAGAVVAALVAGKAGG